MHYHSAQLRFKILSIWRLQLRSKLKMAKQARIAEKFFIARRAWKTWTDKFEHIRRQKKLQVLERRKMRKYFIGKFRQ
jgi:protein SFI1